MSLLRALPARAPSAPAAARGAIRSRLAWATLAISSWTGVGYLGFQLASAVPSRAGFDLELLLVAGRRVAAGLSPYDLASLGALSAEDLFYSYPPPLAQALALLAPLPMPAVLALLALGSVTGLALVARALGARLAPERPAIDVVLPVVALAPLLFPFAIAILFGNLDATFPFAYGLLALAVLAPAGRIHVACGVALAAASISKLHPASLFVWFALRGGRSARIVAASTVTAALAIVAASLLVGGVTPWTDYLEVVRAGAAADLLDRRNAGPAAQIALLTGGGEGLARVAQVFVSLGALGVTAFAAVRRRDPLESLAWAAAASIVTLPVTWFHYPVALIPFAIAAWLRASGSPQARSVLGWLAAAGIVAALAIAMPVAIWLAVACVLVAVQRSIPR